MASEILSVAQAKALGVGIQLGNDVLELMIDGEDEWLRSKAGPHSGQITIIRPISWGKVYISRPVEGVVNVHVSRHGYTNWQLLAPTPLVSQDGTYIYGEALQLYGHDWDALILYEPVPDTARRRNTLLELLKNTVAYTGNRYTDVPGLKPPGSASVNAFLSNSTTGLVSPSVHS